MEHTPLLINKPPLAAGRRRALWLVAAAATIAAFGFVRLRDGGASRSPALWGGGQVKFILRTCADDACQDTYQVVGNDAGTLYDTYDGTCDTLDELGTFDGRDGKGGGQLSVFKFRFALSPDHDMVRFPVDCGDGTQDVYDFMKCPIVQFFEQPYCTGEPIEADQPWKGTYGIGGQGPDDGWIQLQQPRMVRSIRWTVNNPMQNGQWGEYYDDSGVAQYGQAGLIGLKILIFPLYDLDIQLESAPAMGEFTCDAGSVVTDIGLPSDTGPPGHSSCASPDDRVYCLNRNADAYDWGSMENWKQDYDLDPQNNCAFDFSGACGGDTAQNSFQGYFPLGSATSQLYHVSWGINEAGPCRDHGAAPAEPTFVGPAEDTCILTKFYETCPDTPDGDPTGPWNTPAAVTIGCGCTGNCSTLEWTPTPACDFIGKTGPAAADAWKHNPTTVSQIGYKNAATWPVYVSCAWTRVVHKDQDACCANLFAGNSC